MNSAHCQLFFILMCIFSIKGYAQSFAIPIGGSLTQEQASTIIEDPSGNYFVGGNMDDDGLLCKLNEDGELIWAKQIEFGNQVDYILNLEISSDNYLIGSGNSRNGAGFNHYAFIFKMTFDGDFIWSRKLTMPSESIWACGIEEVNNGNYRIAGSYTNIQLNNYAAEFDSETGNEIWDTVYAHNTLNNPLTESFYDLVHSDVNGADYFCGRFQVNVGSYTYRAGLMKISEGGAYEWCKTYVYGEYGGGHYFSISMDQDADSLVLSIMCRDGGDSPPYEGGIVKTDLDGNISWAKLYNNPGNDIRCQNIINAPDGYVLSGWKNSGDKALFMIKTDKLGNVIWSKFYNGPGVETVWLSNANSRVIIDGDQVLTVGRSDTFSPSFDMFVVKANLSDGELSDGGCSEDMIIITENLPKEDFDHPMEKYDSPLVVENPEFPITIIEFENNEGIYHVAGDTLVSGQTLYLCPGDDAELFAEWSEHLDFEWSTGETSQYIVPEESGMYYVDITLGDCYSKTDSVFVSFGEFELDLEPEISTCSLDPIILDAGEFDGDYLWNTGEETQTIVVTESGIYTVQLLGGECLGYDETIVNFSDPEASFEMEFINGCVPATVEFTDNSSITSGSIESWHWDFGDGNISTEENPTNLYESGGVFTVILTITSDVGCISVFELELTIYDGIEFDYIYNEPTCFGFSDGSLSINVIDDIDDIEYTIKNDVGELLNEDNSNTANTLASGWYYMEIVSENGCFSKDSVFIDNPEAPTANLKINDVKCYGESTGYVVVDTAFSLHGDMDELVYVWTPNPFGENGIGADSTWGLMAGEYVVNISDANGCSTTITFEINEADSLRIAELGQVPALCRLFDYQNGLGVVYGAASGGTPDYNYSWKNVETGDTSHYSTWGGLNPGYYELTITDANGCNLTTGVKLDSINPIAAFTIISDQLNEDLKGFPPVEIELVNNSTNFAQEFDPTSDTTFLINLDYDNGPWQISKNLYQIYDTTYNSRGYTYTVDICLIAFNKNGCSDTSCQTITVFEPYIFTPINIFTPNGDQINDLFTFNYKSLSISEFNCVIVDRWGIVMFEMNGMTDSWNGKNKSGFDCPDGVYFYKYTGLTDNGINIEGQGHVTLIRN